MQFRQVSVQLVQKQIVQRQVLEQQTQPEQQHFVQEQKTTAIRSSSS